MRSARFASQQNDIRRQRNDSQTKRPITRDTFIHCYTVRLSKSPFFFSWLAARPHRSSLRSPYRTYQRSTCSKSTTQYTKGYRLSFAQAITRNAASYPNPSLPNSKNLTWDDKQMVEYFRNFSRDVQLNAKLRLVANFKLASREKRSSPAKNVILATGCLRLCLMELNDQIKFTKRVQINVKKNQVFIKVKFIASIAYLARADDQNRTVARYQKSICDVKKFKRNPLKRSVQFDGIMASLLPRLKLRLTRLKQKWKTRQCKYLDIIHLLRCVCEQQGKIR